MGDVGDVHAGGVEEVAVADRDGVDELGGEGCAVVDAEFDAVVAFAHDDVADGGGEAPAPGEGSGGGFVVADDAGGDAAGADGGAAADADHGDGEGAERGVVDGDADHVHGGGDGRVQCGRDEALHVGIVDFVDDQERLGAGEGDGVGGEVGHVGRVGEPLVDVGGSEDGHWRTRSLPRGGGAAGTGGTAAMRRCGSGA